MLSSMENLVTLLNKTALTEDKEFSCIGNIQIWLLAHIIVLIYVQAYFSACIFLPIYFFGLLFGCHEWTGFNDDSGVFETEHEQRHSNIIRLLK